MSQLAHAQKKLEELGDNLLTKGCAEAGMTAMTGSLLAAAIHEDLEAMEQRLMSAIREKGS